MSTTSEEKFVFSMTRNPIASAEDADPITTEVVRAALNSAAGQMKHTLIRTAFSPVIYEIHDFAVALYDRNIRMLAQAPTLPAFTGTMNFCVEAAVESIGGPDKLKPGDSIIYNQPYGTGSHAQDVAVVTPAFLGDELIGYACNKAHWLDIGAKSPYCTDTTDVFQEGVVIPGIKICREGEFVEDTLKFIVSNCRLPSEVEGDLRAQVASNTVGVQELANLVQRFGKDTFACSVERMFDHGELMTRKVLENIPNGRYVAKGQLDDNGIDEDIVPFEIILEVNGSDITVDISGAPDASKGPINCPFPSTVSMIRVTLSSIVGASGAPTDGHFRPIRVISRSGSLFHPVSPQPCYLYGWPIMAAMEAMYQALSNASPDLVPAGSGADIASVSFWGYREDKTPFYCGSSLPVGQGAHVKGDGATMFLSALAFSRLASAEIKEAKYPIRIDKWEYRPDSSGVGKHRGGMGWSFHWTALTDGLLISTVDQTLSRPFGVSGGGAGTPNHLELVYPDGKVRELGKATDLPLPKGTRVHIETGGGGGYGAPAERSSDAVLKDLEEGLVTEETARRVYPQVFAN